MNAIVTVNVNVDHRGPQPHDPDRKKGARFWPPGDPFRCKGTYTRYNQKTNTSRAYFSPCIYSFTDKGLYWGRAKLKISAAYHHSWSGWKTDPQVGFTNAILYAVRQNGDTLETLAKSPVAASDGEGDTIILDIPPFSVAEKPDKVLVWCGKHSGHFDREGPSNYAPVYFGEYYDYPFH
ncbi:hypothetical protein [Saccharothrix sp. HUAS TT1]|uniref:hypothetical protein n=1 Tax=unclassified Saccharothrix TaxID=2593673 RepID=UPI00345BC6CE